MIPCINDLIYFPVTDIMIIELFEAVLPSKYKEYVDGKYTHDLFGQVSTIGISETGKLASFSTNSSISLQEYLEINMEEAYEKSNNFFQHIFIKSDWLYKEQENENNIVYHLFQVEAGSQFDYVSNGVFGMVKANDFSLLRTNPYVVHALVDFYSLLQQEGLSKVEMAAMQQSYGEISKEAYDEEINEFISTFPIQSADSILQLSSVEAVVQPNVYSSTKMTFNDFNFKIRMILEAIIVLTSDMGLQGNQDKHSYYKITIDKKIKNDN